jgi:hypothetical protein
MPGRCLTGSKPFKTRIELSEYSAGDEVDEVGLVAIAVHCSLMLLIVDEFTVQIVSITGFHAN